MTTQISAETLAPITHNQLPVITTELLAQLYGTTSHSITKNHRSNIGRFVCGKHYFKIEGSDLKDFKNKVTNSDLVASRAKHLILWTERGAARHAKMLETDQAWEVFEKLEDCYFSQKAWPETKASEARSGKITAEQQEAIKQLVMSRGKALPKEHQAKAMITMWSSLKSHFGCSYKNIGEDQFTEALSLAARLPLEGELIGKPEQKNSELSLKELDTIFWLWDYANRSQALFRELYPAIRQIKSGYSGKCYDYSCGFAHVISAARDVLIIRGKDVDINEPGGPTNLAVWVRIKNNDLPPTMLQY
ncbi:TPA: phage repressor protein/antirepressor Ant [Salmonella enterica]|nr:phage repressor protein/antirepressor Ant [Salmonella enterica subsp. enterica serovar Mbandaka]EEG1432309.1 phage repressor protein/antirepressor Ant [Salmonella enterica subsp. enterica serovar Mbandaka]EIF3843397.1 ORF6N domain-containing protein [Salmonella enterica subsp. enterica serovar Mbandaka]EII7274576.1 ORF6N domain-containing protein [Salmonella enterica subsp. enterica serovar Mbandaka]HAG4306688.1 phage repressor protein/antirepressor Ant [Salmonella enterica]